MTTEVAEGTLKFYVDHLTSRIDKHSIEQKDGFEKISESLNDFKVQQMKDTAELRNELTNIKLTQAQERLDTYKQIAAVQQAATADNNKLNMRVAVIMTLISVTGGGVGSRIERKFFPEPEKERTVIKYESSIPDKSDENH